MTSPTPSALPDEKCGRCDQPLEASCDEHLAADHYYLHPEAATRKLIRGRCQHTHGFMRLAPPALQPLSSEEKCETCGGINYSVSGTQWNGEDVTADHEDMHGHPFVPAQPLSSTEDEGRPHVVRAWREGPDALGTPDGEVWQWEWSDGVREMGFIPGAVERALRAEAEAPQEPATDTLETQ